MSVGTTDGEVLLKDVWELLQCSGCGRAPMLPPVLMCRLGHPTCADCRSSVNKRSTKNIFFECHECEESLPGRNLPLEEILLSILYKVPQDSILIRDDKEELNKFGEETIGTTVESQRAARSMADVVTNECHAQRMNGGRTLVCPFPCNISVTAPGLYRHFGFQHPEMYLCMLYKNHPFTINIPVKHFTDLSEEVPSRCVYVFVVDIGDQERKEGDNMSAAELLNVTHSLTNMLQQRRFLAILSVGRLSTPETYALWVTALYDFSPVLYTLRCNHGSNCFSYQGRPKSLHKPVDIQGGCLMLPSTIIHENGMEFVLAFHLDLPFPQQLLDLEARKQASEWNKPCLVWDCRA